MLLIHKHMCIQNKQISVLNQNNSSFFGGVLQVKQRELFVVTVLLIDFYEDHLPVGGSP